MENKKDKVTKEDAAWILFLDWFTNSLPFASKRDFVDAAKEKFKLSIKMPKK